MHNQDWSLVFFTILSQLSVGIIVCFSFIYYFQNDPSLVIAKGLSLKNPSVLALIFIALALCISLLHLGSPMSSLNSINNLSGSWVSREILGIGIFVLSLLAIFILGWKFEHNEILKFILPLSAIIGLLFVWFMSQIYCIPSIPSWNIWNTPLAFATTTFVLGITTFLLLSFNGFISIDNQTERTLSNVLIALLFIEICAGIFHQYKLEGMIPGIEELVFNQGSFYMVFLLRISLLIIAFFAMITMVLKPSLFIGNSYYVWMFLMLFLVIIQEFIGRLLFYASYFRVGM